MLTDKIKIHTTWCDWPLLALYHMHFGYYGLLGPSTSAGISWSPGFWGVPRKYRFETNYDKTNTVLSIKAQTCQQCALTTGSMMETAAHNERSGMRSVAGRRSILQNVGECEVGDQQRRKVCETKAENFLYLNKLTWKRRCQASRNDRNAGRYQPSRQDFSVLSNDWTRAAWNSSSNTERRRGNT